VDPAVSPTPQQSQQEAAAAPLVSVLVRSIDRAELREALGSVAAQTYAHIEVVVVAALPGHDAPPLTVGPHPLRFLPTEAARPRSLAANVALDAAWGDYLLFLDDDDWLMPDHIARLVQAVQTHPSSLAAYAGVALVDGEGKPLGQAFDLPFDGVRILSGNMMPIHAVLFSARLRELGCRFDEELDRYEDWDFWIQVARQTVPQHVPGVSAVYRVHASSGVHVDAGTHSAASHRIYDKLLKHSTPQQLSDLMHRVWSYDDLTQQLAIAHSAVRQHDAATAAAMSALRDQISVLQALRSDLHEQAQAFERTHLRCAQQAQQMAEQQQARVDQLERELANERHCAEAMRIDNAAMRNSSSWRLTQPLRTLVGWLQHSGNR
jgi:O-antigen biosynthesis protein